MTTKLIPAFLLAAGSVHAAVLVDWNLDTQTQGSGTFAGISSSSATVASNLVVSDLITASRSGSFTGLTWSSSNSASGELNLQNWDFNGTASSATGDGSADNWLQFSVTASAGYEINLQQISISAWRNGSAAASTWSGEYSIDNGATWVLLGGTPHQQDTNGVATFTPVDFSGSVTDDSFLIRFTATGPVGGTGNIHINDFRIEGTVLPIPEPSSALLSALSVGSLALIRRRKAN
jgi:hypothetical protein